MAQSKYIDLSEDEKKVVVNEYRNLLRNAKGKLVPGDKEIIRKAFDLAMDAHRGVRRKSGEPYILHPLAVARIVSEEVGLGTVGIVCALLHDTVEDSDLTLEDIAYAFDDNVAKIIDGLTKISGVFDLKSSAQAENFRKLLITLTDDIRVVLIKLADRLHNMRTMGSMPKHKQLKISSETLFLYAPIAHRMGLYNIKTELEDLSMKYTEEDMYQHIAKKLNETKRVRSRFISNFIRPLKSVLAKKGFDFEIYGRPKSIHSIWNKMKNKGVAFEEVFDLFAIRIIINSPQHLEKDQCWGVYSTVTSFYRPNPSRLRDWISNPKSNGYEALHTTVMGPKGQWVEVQIRSKRMHEIAEKGVAAHWKYKEGQAVQEDGVDQWLQSIQSLLNDKDSNAIEVVNNFKANLFNREIYIFTPKGDLKRLKKGSTALDFAYEIHSAIGNKCLGAKVNHKLVPLSYALQTGDQVEIITSNKQKPNEDWLNFVATGKAKNSIKKALKDERREIAEMGRAQLERKFKALKINNTEENLWALASIVKLESPLDIFYEIGLDKRWLENLKKVNIVKGNIEKIKEAPAAKPTFEETITQGLTKNAELVIMGDSSNDLDYSFAKCCSPIPGDNVFGFITINDGIKIHRTNCPNAVQLMSKYSYRIIQTSWASKQKKAFLTGIKLNGIDGLGVVNHVSTAISNEMNINIKSITFESNDGVFEGTIMLYVTNINELEDLINNLNTLEGIISVHRFEVEDEVDEI